MSPGLSTENFPWVPSGKIEEVSSELKEWGQFLGRKF